VIAGFIYVVDFENGMQYRRGYPHRRRRIKRDLANIQDCKVSLSENIRIRPTRMGSCVEARPPAVWLVMWSHGFRSLSVNW
jgi:hypothetical protein